MKKELEVAIENTYALIKNRCPLTKVDSLGVVKEVEEYRQFWKPDQTKVVLLAESHVYTDEEDFARQCNQSFIQRILPFYPTRFVRFVYCLGYGEDSLLNGVSKGRVNTGTPQFWKIFCSCVAVNPDNPGYYKILKTGTPSFAERLQNKVSVLRQMKEKGIWLLDSSIVGLYGNEAKNDPHAYEKIIDICWNNYIAKVIEEAQPKFIIVIGKGVERVIGSKLKVPYEAIALPQTHETKEKQQANLRRYSEICNSILAGKAVTPPTTRTVSSESKPSNQNSPIRTQAHPQYTMATSLESKLVTLGYRRTSKNEWAKNNRIIHVVTSVEYGPRIRVTWKEKWKDDHAVIFDYSKAQGPTCIIPVPILFKASFIEEKRKTQAYKNSQYWWTQTFQEEHELPQLVLTFQNRWDLL